MKKKNKKRVRKNIYLSTLKYLKQSKDFLLMSSFLFFLFAVIGFVFPVPEQLKQKILEMIKQILSQTKGFSTFQMIKFIFFNNLKISFFAIFSGIFFGFFPVLIAVSNGYLLGFVSKIGISKTGMLAPIKFILPHGIFEIPALIISLSLGLKLGAFVFQKNKKKFLLDNLINSLIVFFTIILPLLLIAAIIEGTLIMLIK